MELTKEHLIEITRKSIINARALIEDATILIKNQRLERAYTLLQLSTEESGKALLTYYFLFFDDFSDKDRRKKFLRDFRSHRVKSAQAINLDALLWEDIFGPEGKEKVHAVMQKLYNNVPHLDELKNLSLYVSIWNRKIVQPSDVITKEMVDEMQTWANFRCVGVEKVLPLGLDNFESTWAASQALAKTRSAGK